MKRKSIFQWVLMTAFLLGTTVPAFAVGVWDTTTELQRWDKTKAENGVTAFIGGGMLNIIDMEGYVLKQIKPQSGTFTNAPEILENGNVLGYITGDASHISAKGYDLAELDWNGKFIWKVGDPRANYNAHHDFRKIWNKELQQYTVIFLSYKNVSKAEAIAAGGDPSLAYTNAYADAIVEMTLDGTVVWEWAFIDHTVQDDNATWPRYGVIKDNPGKLDIGKPSDEQLRKGLPSGVNTDWTHCNSLDYNPDLDQIVVNAKHMSEFYVIDHGKTFVPGDPAQSIANAAGPDGDFLYRFGKPSRYDQGDAPGFVNEGHQQMYGAHNIQWIKKTAFTNGPALPGAGNFLIFDNGVYCPGDTHSEVLEINPYKRADGTISPTYVNPPDAGYTAVTASGTGGISSKTSKQVVWNFLQPSTFYSSYISSCQRQPNGNTVVDAGAMGHFFEVTASKEVVWSYFNPVVGANIITTLGQKINGATANNSAFRAYRYVADYPGLKGKNLTKKGKKTFTKKTPLSQTLGGSFKSIPNPTGFGYGGGMAGDGGAGGGTGAGGTGGY